MYESISSIISDPVSGPYYGEDYCIDDEGFIQVSDNNVRLAGLIMKKVNDSKIFSQKLVKISTQGDVILLGFDTVAEVEPIYQTQIGPDKVEVAIKPAASKKFCLYINGRRSSQMFKSTISAKKHIRRLEAEYNRAATEELAEESEVKAFSPAELDF